MQPKALTLMFLFVLSGSVAANAMEGDMDYLLIERGFDDMENDLYLRSFDEYEDLELRGFQNQERLQMRGFEDGYDLEMRGYDEELEMRGYDEEDLEDDELELRGLDSEIEDLEAREPPAPEAAPAKLSFWCKFRKVPLISAIPMVKAAHC